MNILIIEDNEADCEWMKEMLECGKVDAELDCAINLEEGKNRINALKYDIVFLDLRLPDSTGIETVTEFVPYIRNSMYNAETPVIIMTGLEDYDIGKKAVHLGIKDFLVKGNVSMEDIKRAVKYATYHDFFEKRNNSLLNKFKRYIGV